MNKEQDKEIGELLAEAGKLMPVEPLMIFVDSARCEGISKSKKMAAFGVDITDHNGHEHHLAIPLDVMTRLMAQAIWALGEVAFVKKDFYMQGGK